MVLSETFWKVQDQNEARLIILPDISVDSNTTRAAYIIYIYIM